MVRFLGLLSMMALASGCIIKSGGAAPSNYDYSEFETYGQPHAASPSWPVSPSDQEFDAGQDGLESGSSVGRASEGWASEDWARESAPSGSGR